MKSSFASFIFILILVTVFQGLSSGNSRETKLSDSSWRLSKKSHELAKPCHISVALSFQTIHESGILNDLTVNGLSFLMRESSFQWNFRGVRVRNGRLAVGRIWNRVVRIWTERRFLLLFFGTGSPGGGILVPVISDFLLSPELIFREIKRFIAEIL